VKGGIRSFYLTAITALLSSAKKTCNDNAMAQFESFLCAAPIWSNLEVLYDYKADLHSIGNRSTILCVIQSHFNVI